MKIQIAIACALLVSSLPSFGWLGQSEHDCIYNDHWGVPLSDEDAGPRVVRTCFNPKDNIVVLFLDGNSVSETLLKPKGTFTQADVNHFLDEERGHGKWKGPVEDKDGNLTWTSTADDGRTAFWNKNNEVQFKTSDAASAESWIAHLPPVSFPSP
jgi:hypothetical protein